MMKLLIYLLFLLSVAFASAGIVLSIRLRNRYKTESFSSLLYFQVFIFTFGFYGIWGQIVIRSFLTDFVSSEAITKFSDISLLLGLPFIVVAWLMLIKFSLEISGHKTNNWFVFIFLILNFIIIIGIGYVISGDTLLIPMALERYYYTILNLLYTAFASVIIIISSGNRSVLLKNENRISAGAIFLFILLQAILLYYYNTEQWIGMLFIFIFFAGNSFLPLYLNYGISYSQGLAEITGDSKFTGFTFDDFCKKYEISPRESEIIREICNGLSNKEISEKLFISLQTVKDHAHRIYIKINVRSRSQLMNMVNETRGKKPNL